MSNGTLPAIFAGGEVGAWRVVSMGDVVGEGLPRVPRVAVYEGVRDVRDLAAASAPAHAHLWALRGVTGHSRYTERRERTALDAVSAPLGRAEATRAALIPIRKSAAWWALPQDERRAIFEERSHHIADTMKYVPAIARRLHHSRELGEPFDFLTWFEYAPEHEAAFVELVIMLRAREEWRWVEREVDVRLERI
jgi:chlorite dismutase